MIHKLPQNYIDIIRKFYIATTVKDLGIYDGFDLMERCGISVNISVNTFIVPKVMGLVAKGDVSWPTAAQNKIIIVRHCKINL